MYRFESDPDRRKRIEQQIMIMYEKSLQPLLNEDKILFPPIPNVAKKAPGEFPLGTIYYNGSKVADWGLNRHEILKHQTVLGSSGQGKSNYVYLFLLECIKKDINFFVFDWKNVTKDLLQLSDDMLVFGINSNIPLIKFNVLIPPKGLKPELYQELLIQIIGDSFILGAGCFNILRKAITAVYNNHDVYSGNPTSYPTLSELYIEVQNMPTDRRSTDWKLSTERALYAITSGTLGQILNDPKASLTALHDLFSKRVILELGGLDKDGKRFLINSIANYNYYYWMNQHDSREKLNQVLVFDEASQLFHKNSLTSSETVLENLLRMAREFGIGVILADQSASTLSHVAIQNSYTTIAFSNKLGADISTIGRSLYLTKPEESCLGKLAIGQAIIKMSGRINTPMLCHFKLVPIKKGAITDADIQKMMQSKGYSTYSTPIMTSVGYSRGSLGYSGTDKNRNNLIVKLLKEIDLKPFTGTTSRFKKLSLSVRKGKELINDLLKQGVITKTIVKNNGQVHLLEIPKSIKEDLNKHGANLKHVDETKDGGIEHRYWNWYIGKINKENGYDVVYEKKIPKDGYIDQVITKNGKTICLEIETGKSTPVKTIIKNLKLGFDKIICIATTDDAFRSIQSRLKAIKLNTNNKVILVKASQYNPTTILA